tara:strand:+ start:378 stop:602 length:225 start_codon:yes stop_codon:yes gene_type:complete
MGVQKTYFHNHISTAEDKDEKKTVFSHHIRKKINVDINILLNRIKIEKKKDNKRKFIFYSSVTSVLLFLTYIIF